MKNRIYLLLFTIMLFIGQGLFSQNVAINTSGNAPHASAMLDIASTTSGLLIPRMTETDKNNIYLPATGLMIYQTDAAAGFWYFDGTAWAQIGGGGDNLYTADGTLDANRTVNQDNKNLTFVTGSGRFVVDGNFEHKTGALYAANHRVIDTPGPIQWQNDDVAVFLDAGYTGNIILPSASANPNRVVAIRNRSGLNRVFDNTTGGDTGIYQEEQFTQIVQTAGYIWLISDGTSWRLYRGRP